VQQAWQQVQQQQAYEKKVFARVVQAAAALQNNPG
jgi:hypothetical protein